MYNYDIISACCLCKIICLHTMIMTYITTVASMSRLMEDMTQKKCIGKEEKIGTSGIELDQGNVRPIAGFQQPISQPTRL